MPKNTGKDTTNKSTPVSVTAEDALGRGAYKSDDGTRNRDGVKPEHKLTPQEQVLVRTEPGAATAADGKFRREYMVQLQKSGRGYVEADWSDPQHEDMHAANKLHILDQALHQGLHPKGEAEFEGTRETAQAGSALLVYAVSVVPAGLDESPENTVVARELLLDMEGKSSVVDDDGNALA